MFDDSTQTQSPVSTPTPRSQRPKLKSARQWWRDIIDIVFIIVTVYTFVNLMTARAIIEGVSMQPNFYTDQLVMVNCFSYYFTPPQRGDAIVLSNPTVACKNVIKSTIDLPFFSNNSPDDQCADYIKRVIGLPGETIWLKQGRVYINGTLLDEPYIRKFCESADCQDKSWHNGPNEYFVLGDNRNESYDSHYFGPINRSLIVGMAWIRYWPLSDAGVIPHPTYNSIPTSAPVTESTDGTPTK